MPVDQWWRTDPNQWHLIGHTLRGGNPSNRPSVLSHPHPDSDAFRGRPEGYYYQGEDGDASALQTDAILMLPSGKGSGPRFLHNDGKVTGGGVGGKGTGGGVQRMPHEQMRLPCPKASLPHPVHLQLMDHQPLRALPPPPAASDRGYVALHLLRPKTGSNTGPRGRNIEPKAEMFQRWPAPRTPPKSPSDGPNLSGNRLRSRSPLVGPPVPKSSLPHSIGARVPRRIPPPPILYQRVQDAVALAVEQQAAAPRPKGAFSS